MHGHQAGRLQALRILEGLGADPLAAKLRKSLREDGVGVPRGKNRKTKAHPIGLTERQDEVLQLLGAGLTNSEIADRLFVSHRTVENHVSAVMGKLGSSSRRRAVSDARTQGLIVGESAASPKGR